MVADQQPPVQTRDRVDESKRLRVVHGDRLLEEHGDAGLEALDRGVDVKRVRVGDDDRIELLGIPAWLAASWYRRTLELHLASGGIGDGDQRGARRRSNELDVLSPHEAGADDADANGRGLGCGHGASLRRCGRDGREPSVWHDGTAARDIVPFSGEDRPAGAAGRMFHSTGHRFANRTKSARVSTATGPQLDSVVDDDLAPCEDVVDRMSRSAIEFTSAQARRRAQNRGESHGHSPIDAPRPNRRVGARSNHACRHRLRRRRHPGEHQPPKPPRRTSPSRSPSRPARTSRRRTTTAASNCSRNASRRPTSASPSSCIPASQLGPDADRFPLVQAGDIDIDLQGASALSSTYEPIGVVDAAYAFDDVDHAFQWIDEGSEDLFARFHESTGVNIVDGWFFGNRTFTTKDVEVAQPRRPRGCADPVPELAAVPGERRGARCDQPGLRRGRRGLHRAAAGHRRRPGEPHRRDPLVELRRGAQHGDPQQPQRRHPLDPRQRQDVREDERRAGRAARGDHPRDPSGEPRLRRRGHREDPRRVPRESKPSR